MKKEKSCGALLTRVNDGKTEVLIIKHKNGGHWSFPKGHVEGEETEAETAIREIKEETGYDAEINENFREIVTFSPKKNVIKDVVYFTGNVLSGKEAAQEKEVLDIKWATMENAFKLLTYNNDQMLLKRLEEFLN